LSRQKWTLSQPKIHDGKVQVTREPGKIILINGASSAGKSTLARSLQQKLREPFLHLSFDHLRESNALPMARIRNGELDWTLMRPAVFDGFHRCLPAFAKAGNNRSPGWPI